MLISIQEISKATAIPETSIRRYFRVFNDVLPEGTRLGRTKKYPPETAETIKIIHSSYQESLSTIEIRGKLSGTMPELAEQTKTTILPPQEITSLQSDIRALTDAVKILTEAIQLYNHNTTTKTPETQKPDIIESEISQDHHDNMEPETPEEPTITETHHDITTESPENQNDTPDITTDTEIENDHNTTKTPETQEPGIVESKIDLLEPPSQHHHATTDPEPPEKETFSSVTIEPPQNYDNITTEAPEDHDTIRTQKKHDTTTETTPEPEPEQMIEPQESTQPEPALETEKMEEPEPVVPETIPEIILEPEPAPKTKIRQKPEIDLDARDRQLIKIYESLPGKKKGQAQARADALNNAGVYKRGGEWTAKGVGDAYRTAKKKQSSEHA
ncbi:MAG: MerR family transcriptional regulator [Thermodesulfobacteriota bacterium]|nr:MerR family transcriptional regulator [Thermodesulfobacteriota bacterium]